MRKTTAPRTAAMQIEGTTRPHTVSQVVLRRFSEKRRRLTRYDIESGEVEPTTIREFGRTTQIALDGAPKFERRWQRVEKRLNLALDAVCQGKTITDPKILEVLRDLVAMHFVRTLDLLAVNHETWRLTREVSIASIAAHPDTAESFRQRHGGIKPAGRQALELEARAMLEEAIGAVGASNFAAMSMLDRFEETRRNIARTGIEIAHASEGEFMISDAPAQTLHRDHPGVGALDGIPLSDAGTIVMPVARDFTIALGPGGDVIELKRAEVDALNRVQMLAAHQAVAWHPDADLRLFADAVRPERRSRVPVLPAGADLDVTHHMGSQRRRPA